MSADSIDDDPRRWPRRGLLLDALPLGVVLQNGRGEVLEANPAAERLLGLTLAQMQAAPPPFPGPRAVRADGSPLAAEAHPAALALSTGEAVADTVMGLIDPRRERRVWIKVKAVPFRDGAADEVQGVYTLIEDVSAQHYSVTLAREHLRAVSRAERSTDAARPQLRARASTLRRILDNLPIPIAATALDAEPRVLFINAEFRRTFGYTPEDIPTVADWARLAYPDEAYRAEALAGWYDAVAEAKRGQGKVSPRELRVTCKDGTVRDLIIGATLIEDMLLSSLVDITERKAAEGAVLEVSHFLRTLIDAIPSPVFYKDRAGRYQGVNKAFEETTGLRRETVIGHTVHDFCNPELAAVYQEMDERLFRDQGTQVYESRVRQADGALHDVVFNKAVYFDTRGVLAGLVGVTLDITGLKRIEAELSTSEAKYRGLVENIPGVVWSADASGAPVYISPNCAVVFGYTPEEMYQGGAERFIGRIHPDDRERVLAARAALFHEHRPYDVEFRIRRKDGDWIWVRDKAAAAYERDGRLVADGIGTDITDRKRIEQELLGTKGRLEAMINALPDLMFRIDREGHILEFRGPSADQLYLPPAEFLGKRLAEVLPEEVVRVFAAAIEEATAGGIHRGSVYALQTPQGPSWFELSVAAMGAPGRPGSEFIAVTRDITERKRYEFALKEARDAAESANTAKGEFLAHMSHEIRTPLNAVLGLAQVLERTHLAQDQRDMVAQIGMAGRSLLAILGDILDLSKIEAGQLRVESVPFDLSLLLDRVGSLMGQTARAKGLGFRIEAAAVPPGLLVGDALRLEQVLLNLTGNAIKFTAEGEVAVRVGTLADGEGVVRLHFAVSDSGIGIAPETRERLFTPFTQGDSGIARRFGGTGLGLAISRRLVALMGGRIGVESEPGRGSTFWFELPFARATPALPAVPEAAPTPVQAGPRLAGAHLLVVDDSAMNRDLVERALALEGATATLAADGQQAVEVLRARPAAFDAVLMDVRMPVMDGLVATRLIRGELGLTTLPVIALTAGVLADEQAAALVAGVDAVLPKPLDITRMTAVLLDWIGPVTGADRARGGAGVEAAAAVPPLSPDDFPAIPGIDRVRAAASAGGDLPLFLRFLAGFCAEFAGAPALTRADLNRGARESAARRLHTLRGNAGVLGALEVADAALVLESAIARGAPDLEAPLAGLDAALAAVVQAAAPWCEAAAV